MRLLHVGSGQLYGGVETLLRTLAECQRLCPEMQPEFALCFEGRIAAELRQAGATVHILGSVRMRNPIQVIRARRRLMQILHDGAFDAVICHSMWPLAVYGPAVRRLNLPLISWIHDAVMHKGWLELWAGFSRPSLLICNSRFTGSTVKRLFNRTALEILYCPVLPGERKLESVQRDALRSFLTAAPESVVLLQASRMEPWKGHRLLLDALGLLVDVPHWVCWIAGGGQRPKEAEYAQSLQALAIELGIEHRIRFLGQRSDIAELLHAADIYCQPNLEPEPFGIAFIEAMHAGLPVVTTAAGGPLEVIDESCGVLVPPNDTASLAAQLKSLMGSQSLRRQLGAAAIRRARQLCDPATQLQRLYAIILETMDPNVMASEAH
jgi:glycosyltransferase involved in cell wall biosynthesis